VGILARVGVADAIDEVCGSRCSDAGETVGTYLALATANRVVAPCSKLAFEAWWATTAGPRFTKIAVAATDHRRFWDAMDALDHGQARRGRGRDQHRDGLRNPDSTSFWER